MEQTGNIYIVEAQDDFKRVHKSIIENSAIDCETLGIYTRIIVLGLKWNLNIKGLSSHLHLSDTKIRKAITTLEREGFVVRTAVKKIDGKFAGWNYSVYPFPVNEEQRSSAGKRTLSKTDTPQDGHDRLRTTPPTDMTENREDNNNKLKGTINLKNKKDFNNYKFVSPEFKETFAEWLEYKKERKESYKTEKSVKLCYNKLVKLSGNNPDIAKQIVEQSMANNWAGLFKLKNENYGKRTYDIERDSEQRRLNSAVAVATRVQDSFKKRLAELKAEGIVD